MRLFIAILALVVSVVTATMGIAVYLGTTVEPALAQGCYTQTYMINGKILICTICPGFTSCN